MLGGIQPMSSPMMNRMLGLDWAHAGDPAQRASASTATQQENSLRRFMCLLLIGDASAIARALLLPVMLPVCELHRPLLTPNALPNRIRGPRGRTSQDSSDL